MKSKTLKLAICAVFIVSFTYANDLSPEGLWKTIDDETGQAQSLVTIWLDQGELKGKITELLDPIVPNPTCISCKGSRKNQPILNMTFIWGFEHEDDKWVDGKILDPNNGKEYKATIEVIDNGTQLSVRGFIGFALIGRTQIWQRVR